MLFPPPPRSNVTVTPEIDMGGLARRQQPEGMHMQRLVVKEVMREDPKLQDQQSKQDTDQEQDPSWIVREVGEESANTLHISSLRATMRVHF